MSDMQNAFAFAHQANIDQNWRLLTTDLAAIERGFIERRLSEEEETLLEVATRAARMDCSNAA